MAEKIITKGDTHYKTPAEIKEIYRDTADKVNFINEKFDEIKSSTDLEKIQNAHQEIYGTKNSEWVYEWGKLQELQEAYSEILEDDEKNEEFGLKTKIENLLKTLETVKKEKIDQYIEMFEWKFEEKENGERVLINDWKIQQIDKQITNFDVLYNKIDEKLEAWSTSLELATVFSKKVNEYKKISTNNERIFFYTSLILSGSLIIMSIIALSQQINIYEKLDSLYPMFLWIPFVIWMLVFSWNRRAEAKKLEESYKHKEVMARAYVGYRETIKDLDTEDNQLLINHMQNLLDAMKTDSSEFLSSKWEDHPFLDFINKFWKKDFKEAKDLLSDFSIDFSMNKK